MSPRTEQSTAAEKAAFLAAIVESSEDSIIGKDLNHVISSWNRGAERMYGYAAQEAIGQSIFLIVPEDKRAELLDFHARILRGERVRSHETVRVAKNGKRLEVSLSLSPVCDERGEIIAISAIARDISEQKKAQELIRTNNALLERMFSSVHVLFAYLDRDFNFIKVNKAYADADQHTPDFFPGKNHFDLYPDEENRGIFQRVVDTGEAAIFYAKPFEYPEHPERGVSYWDWRADPIKGANGKVEGLLFSLLDVTEETVAQRKIAESAAYARSLIEASLDPLVTISPAGKITDVNRASEEVTGIPRERLIGTDFSDYFTEPEKARQGYRRVLAEGQVRDYPLVIRHLSGRLTAVNYHGTVYRNAKGEIVGVFAAARDITERLRAEAAMKETVARLNEAQRLAHIGSWELDLATDRLTWSDEIYRMFEIDPARFGASYGAFLEAIHPEDRERVNRAYSGSLETRTKYSIDHRLLLPGGRIRHVHERCESDFDPSGKPLRSRGTVQDITERKVAEEALARSEASLKATQRIASIGSWELDLTTQELVWSEETYRIFGLPFGTPMTYPGFVERVHAQDRQRVDEAWRRALGGQPYELEHRIQADGQVKWVREKGEVRFDAAGKALRGIGAVQDITERKRAEEELQQERAFSETAVNASPVVAYLIDRQLRLRRWNRNLETITGYSAEEIARASPAALFPEDERGYLAQATREAFEKGFARPEGHLLCRDGRKIPFLFPASRIELQGESCLVGIGIDISEQKRAEGELLRLNAELERRVTDRTAQLETANKELESFAYSVSHDLRAPLRHIDAFVSLLTERSGEALDAKSCHYLQTIAGSAQKMGNLIDDLLVFSRMGRVELNTTLVSASDLVQEIIRDLQLEAAGRSIEWKVAPLPPIHADRALMRQALFNLMDNAVKFTRPRAKAVVEIGFREDEQETVFYVRDNGVGFNMQYTKRLFGVFQRLHSVDAFEGTGIGLANVKRIITRHGGRIWAESELDKGATFSFALPRRPADERTGPRAEP